MRFVEGGGEASRIASGEDDPEGAGRIEIVRLDDVARRPGPTYIKLDIEGAEREPCGAWRSTSNAGRSSP